MNHFAFLLSNNIPITYCTRIPRPFYDVNEGQHKCLLCNLTEIKVTNVIQEQDFMKSVQRQITPYDFWELLLESRAFEISHSISPNGYNHYLVKVNTKKVLEQYGDFVAEVLANDIMSALGKDPCDVLVCPKEHGAAILAYQLAKCLNVSFSKVIGVAREDLEKCAPNAVNLEVVDNYSKKLKERFGKFRPRVFIVDDGINSLHTLSHLTALLNAMQVDIRGGAFFVSRIESKDDSDRAERFCRRKFVFYRMGLNLFTSGKCPLCAC